MLFHVKRISIFSAFKVGCLTYALIMTSLFVCFVVGALPLAMAGKVSIGPLLASIAAAPVIFIALTISIAVIPGLILALHAIIYNIVAWFFGGFVVRVESDAFQVVTTGKQVQASQPTRRQRLLPIFVALLIILACILGSSYLLSVPLKALGISNINLQQGPSCVYQGNCIQLWFPTATPKSR